MYIAYLHNSTRGRCSLKAGPSGSPWAPPPPMAPMAMSPPSPDDFREDWLGAEVGELGAMGISNLVF